jgi:hypothetical protein
LNAVVGLLPLGSASRGVDTKPKDSTSPDSFFALFCDSPAKPVESVGFAV